MRGLTQQTRTYTLDCGIDFAIIKENKSVGTPPIFTLGLTSQALPAMGISLNELQVKALRDFLDTIWTSALKE